MSSVIVQPLSAIGEGPVMPASSRFQDGISVPTQSPFRTSPPNTEVLGPHAAGTGGEATRRPAQMHRATKALAAVDGLPSDDPGAFVARGCDTSLRHLPGDSRLDCVHLPGWGEVPQRHLAQRPPLLRRLR